MSKSFQSMAAYQPAGYIKKTPEGAELAYGMWVSDGFFRTLGVQPVLGRDFREGEDQRAAARTVLLSYKTWQQKFGGRADALGQTVTLNNFPYEVIGVLPKGFSFPPGGEGDYWTPLHLLAESDRSDHGLFGIGRLKDGVSAASAAAEIAGIANQLERQYPNSNRGRGGVALPLTKVVLGNMREILLVLLGGAGLLGKSFYRLLHVETGIVSEHVATVQLGAYGGLYNKDAQRVALIKQLVERVKTLPGVESAGVADRLPLGNGDGITVFHVTGKADDGVRHEANMRDVSPTYFSTVKARLVRGRYFAEEEDGSRPRMAVINEALAREYFAEEDPIRKHLTIHDVTAEIVGVVSDIREGQLDMSIRPAIYQPYYQDPGHDFALVVRGELEEHALLKSVKDAIHAVDPGWCRMERRA